jgi:hypothetical protein
MAWNDGQTTRTDAEGGRYADGYISKKKYLARLVDV